MTGVVSQFSNLEGGPETALITMSAGNYGKAFAYMAKQWKVEAMVIMPETAPANRSTIIQVFYGNSSRLCFVDAAVNTSKHMQ